jgi:hypothetical protein
MLAYTRSAQNDPQRCDKDADRRIFLVAFDMHLTVRKRSRRVDAYSRRSSL